MAKSNSTPGIFQQLINQMNAKQPMSSSLAHEGNTVVKYFIPTGSLSLDKMISNKKDVGGWPCGRIVEVFGEEATGKSTLGYQAMANCQKMEGLVIFYDTENAGSLEMMAACGVKVKEVVYTTMTSLEKVFEAMEENLNTIINTPSLKDKPTLIMLDSLANLKPEAEAEGDMTHNMNVALKKAMQLGKGWRKITELLPRANACLYVVNQQRDKPGVMFGDPKTTTGGNSLKYYASVRVKLLGKQAVKVMDPFAQKAYEQAVLDWEEQLKAWEENKDGSRPYKPKKSDFKGDEILIGYDTTAKLVKNKLGPPHREAEFRLLFAEGVDDIHSWLDYGLKFGILNQIGKGRYSIVGFENDCGTFTRNEWSGVVADQDIYDQMKEALVERFVRPTKLDEQLDDVSVLD